MSSKLSRALSNITVQLNTEFTKGSKRRKLTDGQINALKRRRSSIRDLIHLKTELQLLRRIEDNTNTMKKIVEGCIPARCENQTAESRKVELRIGSWSLRA